jgi:hypothetical protein
MGNDGTWRATSKDCDNANEVPDEITKNLGFVAYEWPSTDGKLYCLVTESSQPGCQGHSALYVLCGAWDRYEDCAVHI